MQISASINRIGKRIIGYRIVCKQFLVQKYSLSIVWETIEEEYKEWFEKETGEEFSTFGLPYDYSSVMHYRGDAFSVNGKNTIITKVCIFLAINFQLHDA